MLITVFTFATTICAGAQEAADVYGIGLGTKISEPASGMEALPVIDVPLNEKDEFEVTAFDITSDSAVLNWKSDKSYLTYTLYMYNIFTKQYDEYLSTTENAVKLTDLSEDHDYTFSVLSGEIVLGEVTFTTGVGNASVSVKNRSSKSIVLSISHPESSAKVLLYRSENGTDFEEIAEVSDGEYEDTNVKEATKYYYKVKCTITRGDKTSESKESSVLETATLKSFGLPNVSGETKTYAYYTAVTAKSSPQYKLLRSDECYTDEETGIRMVDGYYCVALGSYYGTKIGTKYKITLEGGKEINVILCDQKSDRHTDANHQYAVNNQDIVEFYIEKSKLPKGIRGNYGTLEQFSGAVVAIEQYID